jgi:hypothetical protein
VPVVFTSEGIYTLNQRLLFPRKQKIQNDFDRTPNNSGTNSSARLSLASPIGCISCAWSMHGPQLSEIYRGIIRLWLHDEAWRPLELDAGRNADRDIVLWLLKAYLCGGVARLCSRTGASMTTLALETAWKRYDTVFVSDGQIPVDRWHDMIGNPTIADAIRDRLVHRAYRIELIGEGLRKSRAAAPELLLQGGDPLFLGVGRAWGAGGGTGLEELLLPAVEHGRVDAVPVTKVRDGDVFEEMEPKDGNFSWAVNRLRIYLGHGTTSPRNCNLFESAVLPIPSETGHMTMIHSIGWGASAAGSELAPMKIERRDPGATDVIVEILFCGVCHTDVHETRNEWHSTSYPIVPGHEIIGRVRATGSRVTRFAVGDLVGIGAMVDSCRNCEACAKRLQQYCHRGPTFTYNSKNDVTGEVTYGGYSDSLVDWWYCLVWSLSADVITERMRDRQRLFVGLSH